MIINTLKAITMLLAIFSLCMAQINEKIIVQLGKRNYNIDDVRLGDYKIKKQDQTHTLASEEIKILLNIILHPNDVYPNTVTDVDLATLIVQSKTINDKLSKSSNNEILWSESDQKWLDEEIYNNYERINNHTKDRNVLALVAYIRAQHLFTLGKNTEGIIALKDISNKYPGTEYEARSEGEIAFRYFKAKNYHAVLNQADRVIYKYPGTRSSQDAYYFAARSHHLSNQHQKSINYFDTLITKYPLNKWNEGGKYFRAKSYFFLKKYNEANSEFEDFISKYPNSEYKDDARELMAEGYSKMKQFDKALEMFRKYKDENKTPFEQLAAEAKIAKYAHIERYSKYYKKDTAGLFFYDRLIRTYIDRVNEIIRVNKDEKTVVAQARFQLAQFYLGYENNPREAIKILESINNETYTTTKQYLRIKEKNCADCDYGLIYLPNLYYNLAKANLKVGNIDNYHKYRKYLVTEKKNIILDMLDFDEADDLKNKGEFNQSEMKLKQIYLSSKSTLLKARALYFTANLYYSQNKIEKAKEKFYQIINEFPDIGYADNAKNMITFLQK